MQFPDFIAKEHADEWGDKTGWRLEITPTPERLIMHTWRIDEGKEKYPSSFSVLAADLNPESVTIQEAYEEHDLNHLHANCIFYRDAIVTKRAYEPAFHYQNVELRYPVAKEITDLEAAKKSFQDFLRKCGARPPVIDPKAIEDLLLPLRAALEPARGTIQWSDSRKPELDQVAEIDSRRMLLLCRTWQPGSAQFDQDEFELLSLDLASVDVEKTNYDPDLWFASLYAVDRLSTRRSRKNGQGDGYEMWYIKIVFQTEAAAKHFAETCKHAVGQARERLYQLHRAAAT